MVLRLAWSWRDSVSSATLTIVVSRIDMIVPTVTTAATIHTSRSSPSSLPAMQSSVGRPGAASHLRMDRSISRFISRSLMAWRLSPTSLPRASAISTLARPPEKYRRGGTTLRPLSRGLPLPPLGPPAGEVQAGRDDRQALLAGLADQPLDLAPVQEQLPRALGLVVLARR